MPSAVLAVLLATAIGPAPTPTPAIPSFLGAPWPDSFTAIGTTAAVIVALLLGFWSNGLSDRVFRPRLSVTIEPRLPDCHVVDLMGQTLPLGQSVKVSEQYYCRLRITNRGRFTRTAREIELLLERLWRIQGRSAVDVQPFMPLNLTWSHVQIIPGMSLDRRVVCPLIQPDVARHCDLCHVDSRNPAELRFNTYPEPNPIAGQLVQIKPPGKYELDLILAGSNYEPTFVTLEIDFKGVWRANQDFSQLVAVRVLRQNRKAPERHPL